MDFSFQVEIPLTKYLIPLYVKDLMLYIIAYKDAQMLEDQEIDLLIWRINDINMSTEKNQTCPRHYTKRLFTTKHVVKMLSLSGPVSILDRVTGF